MNTINKQKSGYTMVELIVVIWIISLLLGGILTGIVLVRRINTNNRNELIGQMLMREGMDMVRNLRDSDIITHSPFKSFGTCVAIADGNYRVQWDSQALISSNPTEYLQKSATGLYDYNGGGTATPFQRVITISTVVPNQELRVIVNVYWTDARGDLHTISAEEHMYVWSLTQSQSPHIRVECLP